MLHKRQRYTDLPEEFHKQSRALAFLMERVKNLPNGHPTSDHVTPYHRTERAGLIFWPLLFSDWSNVQSFASSVGCPKPPEPTRTYRRFLRQHTEELLGPLQVPVGEHHFDYGNVLRQLTTADDDIYAMLLDADNYTAFQRLKPVPDLLLRSRVVPPAEGLIRPWMNELPDALVLLFHAWTTLVKRNAINLFDLRDRGVSFLDDGRLFIHWDLFLKSSSSSLRGKALEPSAICKQLEQLKRPFSLRSSMLRRDLKPKDGYALEDLHANPHAMNPYQAALHSTGLCDTITSLKSFCTVIDPIELFRKHNLFDGRVHFRRRQRTTASFNRSTERRARGEAPLRTAKLHTFEFSPALYLKAPEEVTARLEEHQWFPDNSVEKVYAIKRKGVLYFTRPGHLSAKNPACDNDVETWKRALDSLNMVANLDEQGELDDPTQRSKSAYLKNLTEELRKRAGAAFIEDFAKRSMSCKPNGKPSISEREWNRAVQKYTAQQFKEDPTVLESTTRAGNWYNQMVAHVAQTFIDVNLIRRQAMVTLPGHTEPTTLMFYAPLAIDTFERFALASFGVVDLVHQQTPLAPLLAGGSGHGAKPAPYVLAWSRFCVDVAKRDGAIPGADDAKGAYWTPEEDLIMLMNYTTAPRMDKEAWKRLLAQLPNRTQAVCRVHAGNCNALLKRILTPERLISHRFGKKGCTLEEATRTVLLLGSARATLRRGDPLNQRTPFVKKFFQMPEVQLLNRAIPPRYTAAAFQGYLEACF